VIVGQAPAKVILTGEHFVVHGQPALAAAVNLYSRATVRPGVYGIVQISSPELGLKGSYPTRLINTVPSSTHGDSVLEPLRLLVGKVLEEAGETDIGLDLEIISQIPVGVGLGSSASTAVSTTVALAEFLNLHFEKNEILEIAAVQEKHVHKKPSGIDASTITYGGVLCFRVGEQPIRLQSNDQMSIVIGNTGSSRSTGVLVTNVSRRIAVGDKELTRINESAGSLTLEAVKAYKERDFDRLGQLMYANHKLLKQIGVSTTELDTLVEAAMSAGAFGAKLTGAGGGGCMIALSRPKDRTRIADAISSNGGSAYLVELDNLGVRICEDQTDMH
jgi:mevalonate kinase